MKIIIMGCGRVGARLASLLDEDGHEVTVLDNDTYSFRRLPSTFGGAALYGNGIDEEALRRAGIEEADIFVSLTQGDNRNVMSCQIAKHIFNVPRVMCRLFLRQPQHRRLPQPLTHLFRGRGGLHIGKHHMQKHRRYH